MGQVVEKISRVGRVCCRISQGRCVLGRWDPERLMWREIVRFLNLLNNYILLMFMDSQTPAGRVTTSPKKVFNPIGTQSQWSLGWQENTSEVFSKPHLLKSVNSYHNQSSILLGDMKNDWKHEPVTAQKAKRFKEDTVNTKPVWNYNPKTAGKTTMILGDEKPDYRKKDEVYKQRTPTTLTSSRKKKK